MEDYKIKKQGKKKNAVALSWKKSKETLAGKIPSLTVVMWERLFFLIHSLASKETLKSYIE